MLNLGEIATALAAKLKALGDAERRERADPNQMFSIPWEGGRCVFGGGRPGSYAPPKKEGAE